MRLWLLSGILGVLASSNAVPSTPASWDATLYAYPEATRLQPGSVFNPDIARLAESANTVEARLDFKLAADAWQLSLRPLLGYQSSADGAARGTAQSGYLGQWQARTRLGEAWAVSVGREVMNWGPAQFRSPSSPFYFDNGRSNPLRELSGVDNAKLAWTPDTSHSLSLAWVRDSGHLADASDPWRHTWLAKGDLRGDDWAAGLALAQPPGRGAFLGAHGQWTLNDAWLLYGETASSRRADALLSPADTAQPFTIADRSSRRLTSLVGASRTAENGQSLALEFLHDGHGYSRDEEAAYFARAASNPALAGMALVLAPPLLGRNYLHLVWQNNLLQGDDYWRLMWSRNLDDAGNELAGYAEHALSGHFTVFALGLVNMGGARREFSSLIESSLSVGVRLALP